MVRQWVSLPFFFMNLVAYNSQNRERVFRITWKNIYVGTGDRFQGAGSAIGHYFHQDLWAARYIFESGVKKHVDVGSSIEGFVAHVLPFCHVTYVDIRQLSARVHGLEFKQGSILDLPFGDNSVISLSCLHVIEHIGLGRYGDPVSCDGHQLAAKELSRVLAPSGTLLLGTPVGRQRLCFDAHRIFDPQTVVDMFSGLCLDEFSLIDDRGLGISIGVTFDSARRCEYACGLFRFSKSLSS